MQANSFTLQAARDYEAQLLKLADPVRVLPPERLTRRKRVWILRRFRAHAARAALDGRA